MKIKNMAKKLPRKGQRQILMVSFMLQGWAVAQ